MAAVIPLTPKAAETKGLLYWMERVLEEREQVIASPDEDSVHDLRVALRRCRSLASVFEEVDPHPAWRTLRKTSKKLFRSLGVIRDAQIQEAWALKLASADDPLRGQILYSLKAGHLRHERDAKKSAARFGEKDWVRLARELRPRVRLLPADGDAALCLALERQAEAAELHRRALRSEKMKPWHELRIGIKHFRYTVENLLPKLHAVWGSDLKRLQDLLGDVHDLDVLAQTVRATAADSTALLKWQENIARERRERIETYRQLTLGSTSLWNQWRAGLPANGRVAQVAEARLRTTARAADPNFAKTSGEGRLAKKLFKELQRSKSAPGLKQSELDGVMRAAAMLHGIEPEGRRKAANKDARKFLAQLPLPPGWNVEDWQLLALAVRYHRGAEPSTESGRFAKLEPAQQNKLLVIAGILRIARTLRKAGVNPGAKVRVEPKSDSAEIFVEGFLEGPASPKGLAAGKQMLESAAGKTISFRGFEKLAPMLPLEFPAAKESPLSVASD
jgi:CHAD domain-containing protein